MAKHRFGPGNKFGKGGAQPGAGRTPEWLAQKCQDLIDKNKLIDFLSDVAAGRHPDANMEARIKATTILVDRGFGKAPENLTVAGALNLHISVTHYD